MVTVGSRLGPYEVLSPLGAGGMGEVWKARDTRLDRTVAIKVLPSHLSKSPEVRQRFEREAKTISQLSHPHICALYDVGHEDGTDYLVMEYLEGETLTDRIARGPLPLEQTLRFGSEIAHALDKAHRQGIVHRDLKPGNVMLTKSGVKLLDFGLAKAIEGRAQPWLLTSFPTVAGSPALTQEGTILGTFQYMAPEQLEGKEADARTDIFALGAVLYEMATGRKAFAGASQASLISSIMASDPPAVSVVAPLSPPALDRVIAKCLAKDPEDRWQSAHDVASELKWIGESGTRTGTTAAPASARRRPAGLPWLAAGFLLGAAAIAGFLALRDGGPPARRRAFVLTPSAAELEGVAISPDGRTLALSLQEAAGETALFLRSIESLDLKRLPGTEGASDPFWSPDGRHIGFFARGKLRRLALEGGAPQALADADRFGGAWNEEGTILFSPAFGKPLFRVPAVGGSPEAVTEFDASREEVTHYWPAFLPGGKHFLFYARSANPEKSAIWSGALGSRERRLVTRADAGPIYADPGYVIFAREGALLAQRFDPSARALSGDALPLAQAVEIDPSSNQLGAMAGAGLLVYQVFGPKNRTLTRMDREGRTVSTIASPAEYWGFQFSPDGKRLAVSIADPERRSGDLWVLDPARGTRTRLTSGPTDEFNPRWSPDGYVYYSSDREGFYNLYRRSAAGGGEEETVLKNGLDKWLDDLSKDGTELLYTAYDLKMGFDVWSLSTRPGAKPQPLVQTRFLEGSARFSPDARWIAFVSRETGREEVFVAPRSAPAQRHQVSVDGGNDPRWSPDGKEVFFSSPTRVLMAAAVRLGTDSAETDAPRRLFANEGLRWSWGNRSLSSYEVAPDGRFLVSIPVDDRGVRPVVAVLDWTAGLPK